MKIEVLPKSASPLVDGLVSGAFGYPSGRRFLEDFPVWASDRVIRLGVLDQGKLLSHVGFRICTIETGSGSKKVALIGAVATDAAHRGRGLSSKLLTEALARIDGAGCEWSFLWGSEHEFYSKFGFRLSGEQARALLSDLSVPTEGLLAKAHEGMNERIWQDLLSRKSGIRFEAHDRDWMFAHRSVRWLHLSEPFAYIGYERGMDLKHTVHETGGAPEGIRKLLLQVYFDCPIAQILGTKAELLALGFKEPTLFLEALCLARPRNPETPFDSRFWVSGLSAC